MHGVIVLGVLLAATLLSSNAWTQDLPVAVPDEPPDAGAWVVAPSNTGKVKEARFFHLRRMIRIDFTRDGATLWLSPKLKSTVKGAPKASMEMLVKESPSWVPSLSVPGRYINLERVGWIQVSESQDIENCKPERCLVHLVYDDGTVERIWIDLTSIAVSRGDLEAQGP